jgi:hypothetical protein
MALKDRFRFNSIDAAFSKTPAGELYRVRETDRAAGVLDNHGRKPLALSILG